MLDYHDLLFRWVNFFVLCFIAYKLFYKYLHPQIKNAIYSAHEAQKALHERIHRNTVALTQEQQNLIAQKNHCDYLIATTKQWDAVVQQQIMLDHQKFILMQDNYRQKQEQQYTNYFTLQEYQRLLPEVMHTVEKELHTYYSDTEHQQQYLQQIINLLNQKETA